MKKLTSARSTPRQSLQTSPIAAAVATLLCAGGVAQAQTAAAPPEQIITITGIRRGIESAISTKKNADGVVEAISAEDIGKLPDTTIAESLARLPGVTTQRDRNGNATNITIRGLGPDFNGYLLNGREQTSTGDSRGVDLSVYPAELIGSATVYKTGDASLATAGLAGTIDNRLIDPLAMGGRIIAGSIKQEKTGVGLDVTGKGKRYSLSYIDQFADRTIGLAIGFVHSDGDSSSLASGSWGNTSNVTTTTGATGKYDIPFGGGISYETDANKDKRDGLAAILSYKPNKNFQTELDFYSGKIKTSTKKTAVKNGTNGADVFNATVSGTTVTSGTVAMPPGGLIVYSENIFDDDKIDSLGWKSTLKFGDGWSASLDVNSNKAKRVQKDIEAYAGIATADTLSFKTDGNGVPQFTVGNPGGYTDPASLQVRDQSGWSGVSYPAGSPFAGQTVPQAGYNKGPSITDKLDAIRVDFGKDLGDAGMGLFTDVQFGLNYSKRSKERVTDEGLIVAAGADPYARIPYPAGFYVVGNVGGTGLNVLTFDPQDGLWAGATVQRKYNDDILSKTWTVTEKVTTAYAKLNLDTTLGKLPISGNVGMQMVRTDQSSAGYRANVSSSVSLNNPAGTLVTAGTTYTDFLPSLNLKGDLGNGYLARFSLGKQIARPTLTDMRNSYGISLDTQNGILVASGGSPDLKPFKATAVDLSFEKYFATKAYFSVAGFYKKLDTYITQQTALVDLSADAKTFGVAIPPGGPIGISTRTVNGNGGNISGIELAGSVPFGMFTSVMEGFGATASYSNTSSSVNLPNLIGLNPTQQVPNTGGKMQLPGLSKTNTKLMLYYEAYGFSAFVAQNKRSAYVGSVSNSTIGGYPALARIDPQSWVSAQVGYEFQSGYLKGLGVRFEGNNLNKPVYREDNGSSINENRTGASYAFKLNYKYQ